MKSVSRERWDKAIEQENIEWRGSLEQEPDNIGGNHGCIVCHAKYFNLFEEYGMEDCEENKFNYDVPVFDLKGKTIVDIAGGPHSLLLRCENYNEAYVVDPGDFPDWIKDRYRSRGITLVSLPAEEFVYPENVDEVWMYNALTHFYQPQKAIEDAMKYSNVLRINEPLEAGCNINHPIWLTQFDLEQAIGQPGNVKEMNEPAPSPRGKYFYGVFYSSVSS